MFMRIQWWLGEAGLNKRHMTLSSNSHQLSSVAPGSGGLQIEMLDVVGHAVAEG